MKARDELTTATLRMLLTAVTTEEVAGSTARELGDEEVLRVSAARPRSGARPPRPSMVPAGTSWPQRERAEGTVLDRYLPSQLDDAELQRWWPPRCARRARPRPARWAR